MSCCDNIFGSVVALYAGGAVANGFVHDSSVGSCMHPDAGLKKGMFLYSAVSSPLDRSSQSTLHFTPWQTCSFQHQLGFSGKHSYFNTRPVVIHAGHQKVAGDQIVAHPRLVSALNHKDTRIKLVAASDAATVVITTKGDVFALYKYRCRKVASR